MLIETNEAKASWVVLGSDDCLADLIEKDPKTYLGHAHVSKYGSDTGLLVKLLDAAERLTIQVHPDNQKAMALFNSPFGKTEAWYILGGRSMNGEPPHIYLGFKEGIKEEVWTSCFYRQDVQGMLNCLHKVYVEAGEVYLIEGGTPHAIGAGCTIVEIQEPTDLTIRIERRTPGGYEIPDRICHQGLGFRRMFQCFNYLGYDYAATLKQWRLYRACDQVADSQTLISYEDTPCFSLKRIVVDGRVALEESSRFSILFVIEGGGALVNDGQETKLQKGDQFFIPPRCESHLISQPSNLVLLQCFPPKL